MALSWEDAQARHHQQLDWQRKREIGEFIDRIQQMAARNDRDAERIRRESGDLTVTERINEGKVRFSH